jgi:hypothetical protein
MMYAENLKVLPTFLIDLPMNGCCQSASTIPSQQSSNGATAGGHISARTS